MRSHNDGKPSSLSDLTGSGVGHQKAGAAEQAQGVGPGLRNDTAAASPLAGSGAATGTAGDIERALLRSKERERRKLMEEGQEPPTVSANPPPAARARMPKGLPVLPNALNAGYMAMWSGSAIAGVATNMMKSGGAGNDSVLSAALKGTGSALSAMGEVATVVDTSRTIQASYDKVRDAFNARIERLEQTEKHGAAAESGAAGEASFHDLHKANKASRVADSAVRQSVPGMVRDIISGSMSAVVSPVSMAGIGMPSGYDAAMAFMSPVTYGSQSYLRHRATDRSEARTQRAVEALTPRDSAMQPVRPDTQNKLDQLLLGNDISKNLHNLLTRRGEQPAQAFLHSLEAAQHFDRATASGGGTAALSTTLDLLRQFHGTSAADCVKNAFQFSGPMIADKVFNVTGRDTALNSPASRDAIRSAVLDAVSAQPLMQGDQASVVGFLDQIYEARNRAIGHNVHANPQALDASLQALGLPKDLFSKNTKDALIRTDTAADFLSRFLQAPPEEQQKVSKDLMHFDRMAMFKPGSTVHNTERGRNAIREEMATAYAQGYSLDRIEQMKLRRAMNAAPPITQDITKATLSGSDLPLRRTLLGSLSDQMEALRTNKRLARFEGMHATFTLVGAVTSAVGGPAAMVGVGAAIRSASNAANWGLSAFRSLVSSWDALHKKPITMDMQRECEMLSKPYLAEISHRGLQMGHLSDPGHFMRSQLGMKESRVGLVEKLLSAPETAASAQKYLEMSDPLATLKMASHFLAESLAGLQGPKNAQMAADIVQADPALASVRDTITAKMAEAGSAADPSSHASALSQELQKAYFSAPQNPLEMAHHVMAAPENFTFLSQVTGRATANLKDPSALIDEVAKLNPAYSIRVFAAQLQQADNPSNAEAKNLLRALNFKEPEIDELSQMPLGKAATALTGALLNANMLTRNFSSPKINPEQLTSASAVARNIQFTVPADDTSLQWRGHFERQYLNVEGNTSPPGLASLSHAVLMAANAGRDGTSRLGKQAGEMLAQLTQNLTPTERQAYTERPWAGLQAIASRVGGQTANPFRLNVITPGDAGLERTSLNVGRPKEGKALSEATIFLDRSGNSFLLTQPPAIQPRAPKPPGDAA